MYFRKIKPKSSKSIRVLADTINQLIPSIINIFILILLIVFIYAIVGINLFAAVKFQNQINDYTNFRDFISALALLFK